MQYDGSPEAWKALLGSAKLGKLAASSPCRSVAWRLFLGCLPADVSASKGWARAAGENRERYALLRARHIPDFSTSAGDPLASLASPVLREGDGSTGLCDSDDPPLLVPGEGDVWATYEALKDLRLDIQKDLDRLFMDGMESEPEGEKHFMDPQRQRTMKSVLFVWSCEHYPSPSYRQGMHELLALLILALERDARAAQRDDQLAQSLCGEATLEADAFALFEALMEELLPWFHVDEDSSGVSPVLASCNRVQGALLRRFDAQLADQLQTLGDALSPQLYGVRWLRLLFGREYPISEVLALWDALFAISALHRHDPNEARKHYLNRAMPLVPAFRQPRSFRMCTEDQEQNGGSADEGFTDCDENEQESCGEDKKATSLTTSSKATAQKSTFSDFAAVTRADVLPLRSIAELVAVAMVRSVRDAVLSSGDDHGMGALRALMKWQCPGPVSSIVASALAMLRLASTEVSVGSLASSPVLLSSKSGEDPLLASEDMTPQSLWGARRVVSSAAAVAATASQVPSWLLRGATTTTPTTAATSGGGDGGAKSFGWRVRDRIDALTNNTNDREEELQRERERELSMLAERIGSAISILRLTEHATGAALPKDNIGNAPTAEAIPQSMGVTEKDNSRNKKEIASSPKDGSVVRNLDQTEAVTSIHTESRETAMHDLEQVRLVLLRRVTLAEVSWHCSELATSIGAGIDGKFKTSATFDQQQKNRLPSTQSQDVKRSDQEFPSVGEALEKAAVEDTVRSSNNENAFDFQAAEWTQKDSGKKKSSVRDVNLFGDIVAPAPPSPSSQMFGTNQWEPSVDDGAAPNTKVEEEDENPFTDDSESRPQSDIDMDPNKVFEAPSGSAVGTTQASVQFEKKSPSGGSSKPDPDDEFFAVPGIGVISAGKQESPRENSSSSSSTAGPHGMTPTTPSSRNLDSLLDLGLDANTKKGATIEGLFD